MKNVVTVVGTRPNFIKSALLSEEYKKNSVQETIIHTGQHYDVELSENIFNDLNLRNPDINLGINSGSQAFQTGKMIIELEKHLLKIKPKLITIFGDTNSTLAAAICASKLDIPFVHIEAGERTLINGMQEEENRIICDQLASLNCCATKLAVSNLKHEKIHGKVVFTGDLMLDLFLRKIKEANSPSVYLPKEFVLLTIHRAENTNNQTRFKQIIKTLGKLNTTIVWPMHQRAKKYLSIYAIDLPKNFITIAPVSYTQMIWLESNCYRVITDSGGVQKEAYWSGTPCINLLPKTAWTQTLEGQWNQLIGDDVEKITHAFKIKPKGKPYMKHFGDGHAAFKIYQSINDFL
ncbi:MAG: UDP-n-acetylglucosamine 2-epimerase [Candidatus Curtissbacteria bacterium GW2011_GWA1_40_16]|uniref:UDP-n-acetylglucosamine 2-epimerase n=1 Tax=Candidatus Curtissbacteria bacterium GW2011_GWA1_40_16 TaxID=1618405 RepID=A0A0G0RC07_9BACT|nr:MAG: UDP-n-acetylglucosamine 2-epimerase [Candidatus Curtissbacteria bacterium GW2011_GWA1_40_16]